MNLFKYYKNAALYPSIFVLFFSIVYSLINNYKSDPLALKSVFGMSIMPTLIFIALMCVLSLTIFLNKFDLIKKNPIGNILAWFLLPLAYISIVLYHDIEFRIRYDFGFGIDFFYLLIMVFPYVFGLCRTFIQYRMRIPR